MKLNKIVPNYQYQTSSQRIQVNNIEDEKKRQYQVQTTEVIKESFTEVTFSRKTLRTVSKRDINVQQFSILVVPSNF